MMNTPVTTQTQRQAVWANEDSDHVKSRHSAKNHVTSGPAERVVSTGGQGGKHGQPRQIAPGCPAQSGPSQLTGAHYSSSLQYPQAAGQPKPQTDHFRAPAVCTASRESSIYYSSSQPASTYPRASRLKTKCLLQSPPSFPSTLS